mmetsp:Transcript_131716/g.332655  ORF Transcript_131716/g.332655 Transcript_131716/m.332655 type:complete len:593 (+) Transcript_131716:57-1835(+)
MVRAVAAVFSLAIATAGTMAAGAPSQIVFSPAGPEAHLHESVQTCNATVGAIFHSAHGFAVEEDLVSYGFMAQVSGCYLVEEKHPQEQDMQDCGFARSSSVPVRIEFCKGGVKQTSINQTTSGNTWRSIGLLPFYVGFPGRVAITRPDGPLGHWCQEGKCAWTASSFRLTWLAETCREAVEIQQQSQAPSQSPSQSGPIEEQQESAATPIAIDDTAELFEQGADRTMGEQLFVNEPELKSDRATFTFKPPRDGCYLVEERHAHDPKMSQVALTVNYCKNKSASGSFSQADGRHDQWNYVATLPFYEGLDGSIELPEVATGLLFRLTHVGPKCGVPSAQVHRMELRLTVDFATVADSISEFKVKLADVLASAAQVEATRLTVANLRAGSVIAEAFVRPPAAGFVERGRAATASEAVAAVEHELVKADSAVSSRLCKAVGGSNVGCAVSVLSSGHAVPMVVRRSESSEEQPASSSTSLVLPICLASAAAILLTAGLATIWLIRRRRRCSDSAASLAQPEIEQDLGEKQDGSIDNAATKEASSLNDDASTITPEADAAERGEIMSEHSAAANGNNEGAAHAAGDGGEVPFDVIIA